MIDSDLDKVIRKVPDYPKKGILFYDITGLLTNPEAFRHCIERMVQIYRGKNISSVAAIEARGFLFAAPFALEMGLPIILVRKAGKLPGEVISRTFDLEYGTDTVEIHKSDVSTGKNILLVDDLVATGGTLRATKDILEQGGGIVNSVFGVIGLPFLNYAAQLNGVEITTLIDYHGE